MEQNHLLLQAVVNEDAVGTNMMLKAELQRVKLQLAAMQGQSPCFDNALATSLAFDDQPNTAAAQAAQVGCFRVHYPGGEGREGSCTGKGGGGSDHQGTRGSPGGDIHHNRGLWWMPTATVVYAPSANTPHTDTVCPLRQKWGLDRQSW